MEIRIIIFLFSLIAIISVIANSLKYYYKFKNSNENTKYEEVNRTDTTTEEEDSITNIIEEENNTDISDININKSDITVDNSDYIKDIDYFIATYKSQKGKKIKAFNPLAVLINNSQYYLTYLENSKESNSENIRNAEEAELEINITNFSEGYFDSPKDGFIKIKVYFLDPLPSS